MLKYLLCGLLLLCVVVAEDGKEGVDDYDLDDYADYEDEEDLNDEDDDDYEYDDDDEDPDDYEYEDGHFVHGELWFFWNKF